MASKSSGKVTRSRFELEDEGQGAYLEFETDDRGWITLIHTEVPPSLRGRGIASTLARAALEYARDNDLKVDVICPNVADFIAKNPEFDPPLFNPSRSPTCPPSPKPCTLFSCSPV